MANNGLNRQELIGNLAKDAELNYVGEKGTPKLTFRVVVNTGFGDFAHTEGFDVVLWGKRADGLAPHLVKGKRVFVAGETRTHSWEDKDTGQKKYRTEVVVPPHGDILLLSNGDGGGRPAPEAETGGDGSEEEIPF
jgi:single-strand DNA-binding protein